MIELVIISAAAASALTAGRVAEMMMPQHDSAQQAEVRTEVEPADTTEALVAESTPAPQDVEAAHTEAAQHTEKSNSGQGNGAVNGTKTIQAVSQILLDVQNGSTLKFDTDGVSDQGYLVKWHRVDRSALYLALNKFSEAEQQMVYGGVSADGVSFSKADAENGVVNLSPLQKYLLGGTYEFLVCVNVSGTCGVSSNVVTQRF